MYIEELDALYSIWQTLKRVSDDFLVLFATFEQQKEKDYEKIHETDNTLYEVCESLYKMIEVGVTV